jgi:ribosomal-protein-alanine N-acetyltransferase
MFLSDWRPPILYTDRLMLRSFEEADAKPLFSLSSNPNVTRFTLWEHHKSIVETEMFVRDYARCRYLEGVPEPYAVCLRDENLVIGAVGCFWNTQQHLTMELGYWIGEPFWGRGYAVEACRAVVTQAFEACRPERMQARVIAGNEASERVLDTLGFRFEGTLRSSLLRRGRIEDVKYFSVLKSEWQSI